MRTTPLVSLLVTALGLTAVFVWSRGRDEGSKEPAGVLLVDTSSELGRLLEERAGDLARVRVPVPRRIPREPLPRADARVLIPALRSEQRFVPDPDAGFAQVPGLDVVRRFPEHPRTSWHIRTNSHALRSTHEPSVERPDLRVLVTGDSHTSGVVPENETLTSRLEALLRERRPGERIEVWNAGCGGYSFFEYAGVLDKHRDLEPDVFVVVVYGGNDFVGGLPRLRYHLRCRQPSAGADWGRRLGRGKKLSVAGLAQEFHQLGWLARVPEDGDFALAGALSLLVETAERCTERGVRCIVAYLPPAIDVDPTFDAEERDALARLFGLDEGGMRATDLLADRLLAGLQAEEVETLDLRPYLRAEPAEAYWHADHHLATRGHALVGRALADRLEPGDG